MEHKIRWGILGAGGIAHRFARSLAREPASELVAVSCRTDAKAAAFAAGTEAHPLGDHEQLLADESIDAIYLALPHGLHATWAQRALRAGKAVLCEKPAALSAAETRAIAETARAAGLLFMEAQKARFTPAYMQVRSAVSAGAIGEPVRVEASLCNEMAPARLRGSYLLDPLQGGALLDCGIYCASWLEDYLPGAISVESARAQRIGGVDACTDAELRFSARTEASDKARRFRTGHITCAFDRDASNRAVLFGTLGRIVVTEPHRPRSAVMHREGADPEQIGAPYIIDDFYGEIAHFATLLRNGTAESPIMPLAASIRCAELLDRIRAHLAEGETRRDPDTRPR